MRVQNFEVPETFRPLMESDTLYRIAGGGRGGAKSEFFAGHFLCEGLSSTHTFLNAREIQKSLEESVYATYEKVARRLNIYDRFRWLRGRIICPSTGSEYLFHGLAGNQMQSIKSIPNLDRIWLEEGQAISKSSFEILKPTFMRNVGAQCWISYNPELEDDPVHVLAESGDPRVTLVRVSLEDNPWATDLMFQEREQAYKIDPITAAHVWGGACVNMLANAIYAIQMAKAQEDGRIGRYPYKPGCGVSVAFDLGGSSQTADHTSCVVYQWIAGERRYIKSIEGRGEVFSFYCDWIRDLPFSIDRIILPHDADHHVLQTSESIYDMARNAFPDVEIIVLERTDSVGMDINHVKEHFEEVVIDADGCQSLLTALKHYQWAKSRTDLNIRPLHDTFSDTSDAFRYSMVAPLAKGNRVEIPSTKYWG